MVGKNPASAINPLVVSHVRRAARPFVLAHFARSRCPRKCPRVYLLRSRSHKSLAAARVLVAELLLARAARVYLNAITTSGPAGNPGEARSTARLTATGKPEVWNPDSAAKQRATSRTRGYYNPDFLMNTRRAGETRLPRSRDVDIVVYWCPQNPKIQPRETTERQGDVKIRQLPLGREDGGREGIVVIVGGRVGDRDRRANDVYL